MELQELRGTALFHGLDGQEIAACLRALDCRERRFARDERILSAGDTTDCLGLVLEGSVRIESNDLWGDRTILSHVGPGDLFAETFAFLRDEVLLVDVCANEPCRILFVRLSALDSAESWARRLTRNLLTVTARKNLHLTSRSFHTAPKSVRGRLLSYLNSVSLRQHSRKFSIPFDRQQLADYLNVERTALSKELGRMRREGLLLCRKNHFQLTGSPEE